MRKISAIILILITLFLIADDAFSQSPIVKMGCAEYLLVNLYNDGTVKCASQEAFTPEMETFSIDSIRGVDGGQYGCVAWDTAGKVYELFAASGFALSSILVTTDEDSNPFTDNRSVTCMYRAYISIRGEDSTLWYWGIGDPLNLYSGATITQPVALDMPAGKKMKKILGVGNTGLSNGLTKLVGLATDGTLWEWNRGTATPVEISIAEPVLDFTCTGFYAVAAVTATKLYGWGWDSRYVGTTTIVGTPTDMTSNWTSIGVTFPIKEVSGNTHSFHLIDANDNLFASGSNTMGCVGIGSEYTPMRTLTPPFQIDISENSAMLVSPVQIMGKVKNLQKGQTIAFYGWVQDLFGNWYSWGRNKVMCLGNYVTLPAYSNPPYDYGYDDLPNALDIVAPISVEPDTLGTWLLINFNPDDSLPPFAGAGFNQYISTTSTTLYGKYFQQEHAITGYEWTQVSGASCTIVSPTNANTSITGLTEGSYTFRFTVTNSNEQTSFDDVVVVVSGVTPPPSGCLNCIILRNTKIVNE